MITKKVTPEIELWNKLKIVECIMTFSCGGDSMSDYDFKFYNIKGKEIEESKTTDLKNYFDEDVLNKVEFYVNSDGHYQGEAGTVTITLNEDDDEPFFEYHKEASAEYNETYSEKITIKLSEKEQKIVQEKISSMNGGADEDANVNYKIDCIINDEEETIINDLLSKMSDEAEKHEFTVKEGEEDEHWYSWTTSLDDNEKLILNKKGIKIQVNRNFSVYKPNND